MTAIRNVTNLYNVSGNACNIVWNWTFTVELMELHMSLAQSVDRYVTPVWYLIGLVGNSISAHIWLRSKSKRNTSSVLYLVALAITDLISIVVHSIQELKVAWGIATTDYAGLCETFGVLNMVPQYLSPLLVLGFTVERYISITRPFRSERFSRYKRSPKEILAIVIFAVVLSLPMAYLWMYTGKECLGRTTMFSEMWVWVTEIVMFGGVPIVTLILNICLLKSIKRAEKVRKNSSCNASHSSGVRHEKNSSVSTITLLSVSFYRIFALLPVTIMYALQSVIQIPDKFFCLSADERSKNKMWQRYFRYMTSRKFIQEFGFSHHACNVFIYCATSQRFRYQLQKLVFRMVCSKTRYQKTFPSVHLQSTTRSHFSQKSTTMNL